jgi:hypothetical protein
MKSLIYYNEHNNCLYVVTQVNNTNLGFITEYNSIDTEEYVKSREMHDVIGALSQRTDPWVFLIGEL